MADKRRRRGWGNADNADDGGRGGLDPPFLADIICEQPLIILIILIFPASKISHYFK